ncbi:MAG: extracellular solute-binding protein [Clostridiales bacterium]|nr:extracellular solute-binding protein [Clostridiales bacterium]
MKKRKTTTCLLAFLMTVSMALPFSGCAYERNKKNKESSLVSDHPMTEPVSDPKDLGLKKNRDYFYDYSETPLKVPDMNNGSEDSLVQRSLSNPLFLDNVFLLKGTDIYSSFMFERDRSEIPDAAGPGVYNKEYYLIYDFDGKYLGSINKEEYQGILNESCFQSDKDGNIVNFYVKYENNYQDMYIFVQKYSTNGEKLGEPAELFKLDGYTYNVSGAMITEEGNYILVTSSCILYVTPDGKPIQYLNLDGDYYYECAGISKENDVYYIELLYMSDEQLNSKIVRLTDGNVAIGNQISAQNLGGMIVTQSNNGLYAMTKNALGKLDLSTGEFRQLFDWNQTDLNRSLLTGGTIKVLREGKMEQPIKIINSIDETDFDAESKELSPESKSSDESSADILVCTLKQEKNKTTPVLIHLYKASENPHFGQTVVWLGGIDLDKSKICEAVSDFNSLPDNDVWIKMTDYSDFSSYWTEEEDQRERAIANLYTQMLSGSGPDLIYGLDGYEKFDSNRLLTDLNPYIDSIHGINREEFFGNVLDVYSKDGKLYQLPVTYHVNALLYNEVLIGDPNHFTISNLRRIIINLPEGTSLLPVSASASDFRDYLNNILDGRIDYEQGSVSIRQEDLASIIEAVVTAEDRISQTPLNPAAQISINNKRYLNHALEMAQVNSLWAYLYPQTLGDDIYWNGYPGFGTQDYVVDADISLGIASYSANKEKAWSFISYVLSSDEQSKLCAVNQEFYEDPNASLPLNKTAFEQTSQVYLKNGMKLVYSDMMMDSYYFSPTIEYEGIVEDWRTLLSTARVIGLPDDSYEMTVSVEDIQEFEEFIGSATKRYACDEDATDIILHGIEEFIYYGQDANEKAVEIIESIEKSIK